MLLLELALDRAMAELALLGCLGSPTAGFWLAEPSYGGSHCFGTSSSGFCIEGNMKEIQTISGTKSLPQALIANVSNLPRG